VPPDPFGTAALRGRVLAAWGASPARFREDANAEEDAALGGYGDRLVVELLQNAVDAAAAAGVPARVLLRVAGDMLTCANTGATLTADGVAALSSLRASAKRDEAGAVGRFGVGFAAVLAVSDEPTVVSGGSAVGWSATRTRAEVAALPALQEESTRRQGHAPVLRLPFALGLADAGGPVPEGYATEVRLPLRDPVLASALVADLDPTLALVLPGLAELTVELDGRRSVMRVEEGDGELLLDGARWLLAEQLATVPVELLGDRPVEERGRRQARVRAMWPVDGWPDRVPRVLRAPQPTDEPLALPVLLSVPVPLEPTRRRTVPGPLRDHLLGVAAGVVAGLAHRVPGPAVLQLVPTGLAAGEVDASLARALLAELRADPPLPGSRVLDLGRATGAAYPLLAEVVDGLLPPTWPTVSAALTALGVERWDTAAVVEAVTPLHRAPAWWRRLYDALADAPDREALGALPVPLADGRTAPGPRGLLLPDGLLPDGLEDLGLRLVHPDAASPVLLLLGAVEASPRVLLDELRPRIEASWDDEDTALADAVLPLVAAAALAPGELPWLAELLLTDAAGEAAPAAELVLPGSQLARVLLPDGPLGLVDPDLVARHGEQPLIACGVGSALVVVRGDEEVALLDEGERWLDQLGDLGGAEPVGVRDLELLRWPAALGLLPGLPPDAREQALWWCRRHPVLDGLLPAEVLGPHADPLLHGLYDPAPEGVDPGVLRALGCVRELPVGEELLDLLDRLGDGSRTVTRAQARLLHAHAAAEAPDGDPPLAVRAVAPDGSLVVVPGRDAVVVDAPDLLPLLGSRPIVPLPARLAAAGARVLGVPLASGLSAYPVVSEDPLVVLDADGGEVAVTWRLTPDGELHAGTPEGRGRGAAWRAGRWSERLSFVERLRDPAAALVLAAEDDLAG